MDLDTPVVKIELAEFSNDGYVRLDCIRSDDHLLLNEDRA
jgi:hypothetical protein